MSEGSSASSDSRREENFPDPGKARERIPEEAEPDVHAWYRRGMELLGRGSPAAAAQVLQRASTAEPASRSVREALARAQFDARRYLEAADNFRLIVEASPADDYAHFGLGLSLARSGDPASAAEYLALAAAMRPDVKHYTTALHQVRATLHSRRGNGPAGPSRPISGPAGDEEDD
jgi:Flp pilus assembly protein TadD